MSRHRGSELSQDKEGALNYWMKVFFAEKNAASLRRTSHKNDKFAMSQGFSNILKGLKGRNYDGYTRLEPGPSSDEGTKIILDPRLPIQWSSKTHLVQRPTTADALDRLKLTMDHVNDSAGIVDEKKWHKNEGGPGKSEGHADEKSNEKANGSSMKFVGIFLAAISGIFFTLCSVTVKLMPKIDPSEVLLFRAIVQVILTTPILICVKANPLGPKGVRLLVYLQGIIGCLTVTCIFIGFARLPVGDAATIIFCSPIFVMIFSHLILREHCGIFRFFVIGLLLIGVILIARPPFLQHLLFSNDNTINTQRQNGYDVLGYSAALGGTLLTASNFVCMRKLREVHFSVLIFAFSVMSAILSTGMVAGISTFRLPQTTEEWVYAILVGVFGLFGQSLLAMALRYETAGVVSVTRSMDIAVAYIIQITWFGDIPLWTSILGAFVVIMAVFAMAMEEAILTLMKQTFGTTWWC